MPRISITDFSADDRMDIDCKAFTVATTNLGQIIVPDGGPFHPAIRACNLFDELVGACEELAKAARTFDTKLHAGFKLEELTEDQSRLYNATNDAKAVIAKAKAKK